MKNIKAALLTFFIIAAIAGLIWLAVEYTIAAGCLVGVLAICLIVYVLFNYVKGIL